MLFYRAALPLSRQTLTYVAGIIRRHRSLIGSVWRKLNPGRQALLVLAYLRKGETFADLAAGFEVGTATAWRYVNETVAQLAARAPKLRKAVRDAARAGYAYVVLDGTLIPIDRVAADRPFYSGKHRKHGMNLQVIASPGGDIIWVSGPLPGAVHDTKAAWIWGVLDGLEAAGLVTLADKGYRAPRTPGHRTRGRTSPNRRNRPTAPTPSSAHPASVRTPSSRPGASSASSAAALGVPVSLPKPSTYCRSARQTHDEKGSVQSLPSEPVFCVVRRSGERGVNSCGAPAIPAFGCRI
jgi:DDE superfamily endonuclease